MNWFVEDSTPVLVWGAIFEAALIFALVRTGRVKILYAMVGVALVVGGIVWHEKHTITDTKRIRAVLYEAADAIAHNDQAGVLKCIAPSAASLVQEAKRVSSLYKFDELYLSGIKIDVNRFHNPPSAATNFFARVSGSDRGGNFPFANVLVQVRVTLQLDGERWLVDGYGLVGQNGQ